MITHTFNPKDGILIIEPSGPLDATDFADLSSDIDPHIAAHGTLRGIMVHVDSFPGWSDFSATIAHLKFVESHHQKVDRVAMVGDGMILTELPMIVGHLLHPDIKHFPGSAYDEALQWLKTTNT